MYQLISEKILTIIANASKGLIGFVVLWLIGKFLARLIEKNVVLHHHHMGIIKGVARTVKYICIFLGIVVLLKDLGVDLNNAVTGLGLTGVSLGFALKDTISNVVAGVFILMYRPFHLGDTIVITTDKFLVQGKVQMIDFRYTTLESSEGRTLVPNSILYTNSITIKNS